MNLPPATARLLCAPPGCRLPCASRMGRGPGLLSRKYEVAKKGPPSPRPSPPGEGKPSDGSPTGHCSVAVDCGTATLLLLGAGQAGAARGRSERFRIVQHLGTWKRFRRIRAWLLGGLLSLATALAAAPFPAANTHQFTLRDFLELV